MTTTYEIAIEQLEAVTAENVALKEALRDTTVLLLEYRHFANAASYGEDAAQPAYERVSACFRRNHELTATGPAAAAFEMDA